MVHHQTHHLVVVKVALEGVYQSNPSSNYSNRLVPISSDLIHRRTIFIIKNACQQRDGVDFGGPLVAPDVSKVNESVCSNSEEEEEEDGMLRDR